MKFIRSCVEFVRKNYRDIVLATIFSVAIAALIFFLMPVVWPAASALVLAGIGAAGYFIAPVVIGVFAGIFYAMGSGLYDFLGSLKQQSTLFPSFEEKDIPKN